MAPKKPSRQEYLVQQAKLLPPEQQAAAMKTIIMKHLYTSHQVPQQTDHVIPYVSRDYVGSIVDYSLSIYVICPPGVVPGRPFGLPMKKLGQSMVRLI